MTTTLPGLTAFMRLDSCFWGIYIVPPISRKSIYILTEIRQIQSVCQLFFYELCRFVDKSSFCLPRDSRAYSFCRLDFDNSNFYRSEIGSREE